MILHRPFSKTMSFSLPLTPIKEEITPSYIEWSDDEWFEFALKQFSREDDELKAQEEVLYTREDAIEIYHQ